VPMGFGGPHAAYFATVEKHARRLPGRLVGLSKDREGRLAYRLAIQTREQHIKRDRATSNICTAQVLLAVMAGFYAVYHGPDGLRAIAERVHGHARSLADKLRGLGCAVRSAAVFDTVTVDDVDADAVIEAAERRGINLRRIGDHAGGIACDETTEPQDVEAVVGAFRDVVGGEDVAADAAAPVGDSPVVRHRRSAILEHEVFHAHRAEHELLRYITRLQSLDVGLAQSMIPLGSCTMKLNAAVEMQAVSWRGGQRVRRGVASAECREPGRVRRAAGDPRGAGGGGAGRFRGFRGAGRVPDPDLRARHEPGVRGDGGAEGGPGGLPGQRRHRPRRPEDQGRAARGPALRADDHLPLDARGVRAGRPPGVRGRARARRAGVHGRGEPQRAGRAVYPGGHRRGRLPPEPAQDLLHPTRRRRAGHGADRVYAAAEAVPA